MSLYIRFQNPGVGEKDYGAIIVEDRKSPKACDLKFEKDGVTLHRYSESLFKLSEEIIKELGDLMVSCDNEPYIHKFAIMRYDSSDKKLSVKDTFRKAKTIVKKVFKDGISTSK